MGRRSNGDGQYIDLGNGSWAFRRLYQGKRVQRSARADTETKARKQAKAQVDAAIKLLEAGVDPNSSTLKLGPYARNWLEDKRPVRDDEGNLIYGVEEGTFENYVRDVKRIEHYLGAVTLGEFRSQHAKNMRHRMVADGLSAEVQRTTLVRLTTILNVAEANGDVLKNYAAARLVERPSIRKPERVKPQEPDLRLLLRAVEGDPHEALVWLGLGAGLRRAELLGLRWEDIEYRSPELGVLKVQQRVNYFGKGVGRKERAGLKNKDPFKLIPVGGLVLDVLRRRWVHQLAQRRAAQEPGQHKWRGMDYQPDTRQGFIFTNPSDGLPMNPRSADKHFAAIRDRAGLDVDRFHALRHAFTTLLRASGTRDPVAKSMTGHRDTAMLDYYDDPLESEKIAAALGLDARLRELLGGDTGANSAPI